MNNGVGAKRLEPEGRREMTIAGPNAFEPSYTLEGAAGEHEPQAIAKLVARMVPGKKS